MTTYDTLDAALDALKANNDRLSNTIKGLRQQITFRQYINNQDKPMMKYMTRLIMDNQRLNRMRYDDLSIEARIGVESLISKNNAIIARIRNLKSIY